MSSGVFLIQTDGQLVEMSEEDYGSEADFQELLAKYPNLLAGNQINDAEPRRWLLISREAALSSEENGGDRWSVDHLFLDQDAIPTLVEVKRKQRYSYPSRSDWPDAGVCSQRCRLLARRRDPS